MYHPASMNTTRLNCNILTSEYRKIKRIAATQRETITMLVERLFRREIRLFEKRKREKEEKQSQ